ncbi:MAG: O-acetylhomoserine aminocarboxypropyltransferase/cysteine synthase, partial [Desulfobulbus sp.]|nr:O-acetylhomoserine aminocarboxypropyltransferase/cysteine synthase [Desulfobulbus sp.]
SGRFPDFTEPDPSYHGAVYNDFGPAAFILKARVQMLRDLGVSASPFNSWLTVQGVETLSLRMQQHVANARAVAQFLQTHPKVAWVSYPDFDDHPSYEFARRYLPQGPGAVLTFGIKGGRTAGQRFINSIQLFSHVANIGDCKSLAIHPASTTHSQLSDEALRQSGVTPDMIRLSVGLEDKEDLYWDLDQALKGS